jgi:hypothetical protein
VFKFADSINHCSFTKYHTPLNCTLLDSTLQDGFLMYKSQTVAILFFKLRKILISEDYIVRNRKDMKILNKPK